jgi:hypothetical protein
VVERATFPGPPNYESIAKGDARETYWLLRLVQPACVEPSPSDSYESVSSQVTRIQLVFQSEDRPYEKYKHLVGRSVDATGQLFGAHTGPHHTEVLLTVVDLQPAK